MIINDEKTYSDFLTRTNDFVEYTLSGFSVPEYRQPKLIHDPVWGTTMYYPFELQMIDSPVLQRLRNISQLGLANYTYPSATHSRFEHTLGVCAVVTKMISFLNNENNFSSDEHPISNEHATKLRMAALLHDIGHCFFSHISERMYMDSSEFRALRNSVPIFKKAQAHEIMSFMIVNTPAFKEFFNSTAYPFKSENIFEDIGRMIIGEEPLSDGDSIPMYLTQMINGEFDADSLDYLRRDSYATGLELSYHIDRFLYKIKIREKEELKDGNSSKVKELIMPASGISTIEEMVFGKLMLTRYIYQHPKVLSCDVLLSDAVLGLQSANRFSHPTDYLYYVDADIYKLYGNNPDFKVKVGETKIGQDTEKTVEQVIGRLMKRDLPRKALLINPDSVISVNGKQTPSPAVIFKALKGIKNLREKIFDKAIELCTGELQTLDMYDIYYSIPKTNNRKNFDGVTVPTRTGDEQKLYDTAGLGGWSGALSEHSWSAYIYANKGFVPIVSIAAFRVLENEGFVLSSSSYTELKEESQIEMLNKKLS